MKLNLGCSDQLLEGYLNVDLCMPPQLLVGSPPIPAEALTAFYGELLSFEKFDLSRSPWVWRDSSIEHIRAHDIIEHLPDKIQTMNECWRVLEPGGLLDIFVPTTDGPGAWQDPTHVSYWNRNSFLYYTDGVAERERFKDAYGIVARFRVLDEEEARYPGGVVKLRIRLGALK